MEDLRFAPQATQSRGKKTDKSSTVRPADEAGRGLKLEMADDDHKALAVRLADEAGRGLSQVLRGYI